jgi:chromosome segregation ATPase
MKSAWENFTGNTIKNKSPKRRRNSKLKDSPIVVNGGARMDKKQINNKIAQEKGKISQINQRLQQLATEQSQLQVEGIKAQGKLELLQEQLGSLEKSEGKKSD